MNTPNKRRNPMEDDKYAKRVKKECSYGESCYRKNPAHFREFSHLHLEKILEHHKGGRYTIPDELSMQRGMIEEQLEIIVEKQLYTPKTETAVLEEETSTLQSSSKDLQSSSKDLQSSNSIPTKLEPLQSSNSYSTKLEQTDSSKDQKGNSSVNSEKEGERSKESEVNKNKDMEDKMKEQSSSSNTQKSRNSDYRPIVKPTRNIKDFFKVVAVPGMMEAKHIASAPYHIFYTTIQDAMRTHTQPFSVTFQELLDSSLGELKCSLQINFMVDLGWLLAQYYFAGYSEKKLTILYGEESNDLLTINKKKPHVDAHQVKMATAFGKHHTKMMILCYEDGSLRMVVSTANLYLDDWENRTQGLWLSPKCGELPATAMPHDGESPTMFKRSLLRYLNHYSMTELAYYIERVKRCDFSQINVFLVASVPGSHSDMEWGLARVGSLLRQHCEVPYTSSGQWPLVAQASSLGSYGAQAKLWLTGDFLHNFTRLKNHPNKLSMPSELKLIYPSLENVRQSHDGLLGGGCLPYSRDVDVKQPWLKDYLHQWKATHTGRDKAMPHIKSYTRTSPCSKMAAFYLLTSGNVSKAAWGTFNKGNQALRVMSYEAGVMFLPRFVVNKDFFSLDPNDDDYLIIPYDLPPTRYDSNMTPWVWEYLR